MNTKTTTIAYRTVTILFATFMVMDGAAGIMRVQEGQEIMRHLGYPVYIMSILGVAKVLGALALLQQRSSLLKEWAYAGFTFNFLGACASRAYAGDSTSLVVSPLLFLAFMFLSYFLWKRREKLVFA